MFTTFKGKIETQAENELVKKGDAFFFDPSNPYTFENIKIDISDETFEFSKEDIIFSPEQKKKYKNYLQLHHFHGAGKTFSGGVKYKLHRRHEKGQTKYSIEVDEIKAELKLNWINRQLIEWVHGRKVNWAAWQGIGGVAVVIIMVLVFFIPTKTKDVGGGKPDNSTDTSLKNSQTELKANSADTMKKKDTTKTLFDTTTATPNE